MKFALLKEDAMPPRRKNETDAGIDLYAWLPSHDRNWFHEGIIPPHEVRIVETGVTVEIPKGHFGWITNKSSRDYLIGGGIVDEGYQGELLVKICNISDNYIHVHHGDAIAQLLIIPCATPEVEIVLPFQIHQDKSDRGDDGGIVRQRGQL